MDDSEFEALYEAAATVLLETVLVRYSRADLESVVLERIAQELIGFVS